MKYGALCAHFAKELALCLLFPSVKNAMSASRPALTPTKRPNLRRAACAVERQRAAALPQRGGAAFQLM